MTTHTVQRIAFAGLCDLLQQVAEDKIKKAKAVEDDPEGVVLTQQDSYSGYIWCLFKKMRPSRGNIDSLFKCVIGRVDDIESMAFRVDFQTHTFNVLVSTYGFVHTDYNLRLFKSVRVTLCICARLDSMGLGQTLSTSSIIRLECIPRW